MGKIDLKKLEGIVVNTKNLEELESLMVDLEETGIKWPISGNPIEGCYPMLRFNEYKEDTCINLNDGEYLSWGNKNTYVKTINYSEFKKYFNKDGKD